MRRIIYALQFTGRAMPWDGTARRLKATTTAPSSSFTTVAGPEGVRGTLHRVAGEEAVFESEVVFSDAHTFQESGSITFGANGHRLRFSTVGHGHIGPSADPALSHGAAMWRIDGGEGQFAGATGLITSNFCVGQAGEVTDNHYGVIFVQ